MSDDGRTMRPRWAGHAAAAWAFLFAALSFYWAAGGRAGTGTLARVVREPVLDREPGFVAIVWATGILKVLAGLLALALCRSWGRRVPDWMLLAAGWGTGALLTLYGGIGLVTAAMVEIGLSTSSDPGTTRWYLFLWEPIWLVGGVVFIAAAWRYTRDRRLRPGRGPSVQNDGGLPIHHR